MRSFYEADIVFKGGKVVRVLGKEFKVLKIGGSEKEEFHPRQTFSQTCTFSNGKWSHSFVLFKTAF